MKLSIIKYVFQQHTQSQLEDSVAVLESYSESGKVSGEEVDMIGEMITNICGAIEMHQMVENGLNEKSAAKEFVKKVRGAIDV